MTSDTSSEWLVGFPLKNWPYIVVSNFSWSVRKAVKTCPESGYLFSLSKWKNHCVHGLEISKSKNENFLHIRGTFYPERACQNMHLQKFSLYNFFWSIAIWKCIVHIVTPKKCRSRSPGVRTGVHMYQLFGTFQPCARAMCTLRHLQAICMVHIHASVPSSYTLSHIHGRVRNGPISSGPRRYLPAICKGHVHTLTHEHDPSEPSGRVRTFRSRFRPSPA